VTAVVDLVAQQSAVLDLADRGMHLFSVDHPALPTCIGRHALDRPCDGQRGKHPEPPSWVKASTDVPDVLARMFGRGPRNLAIDAGRSGLLVLDEDAPGELDRLCTDLKVSVPVTFTVSTGKGRHLYLRQPADLPFGNGVGRLAAYKIDVRGRSGYVVGPGSVHATGRRYEVIEPAPVAPVPTWLSDALRPAVAPAPPRVRLEGPATGRAVAGVLRVVLSAPQGRRNGALYWAARRLFERVRDAQLDETAAHLMLSDAASAVGLPGGEAAATIDSARKAVLTPDDRQRSPHGR
jgi:hypothetical protein